MKKLFLFSASFLMLSIAFHLGQETARADWGGSWVIKGISGTDLMTGSGEAWDVRPTGLDRNPARDLPLPSGSIIFWEGNTLVAANNDVWTHHNGAWVNLGQVPSGPIPVQKTTWGEIKKSYGNR